jgi:hypothetical protein
MELTNIEKLLEKYLEATTSIAEENTLREYFLSNQVAPHLQQYQPLFGYFAASKDERFTKTIQLKSQKRNWKWLSIAASVVLLVSVYSGYDNYQDRLEAERVYAETKMALTMLSANLNKGNDAIAQLQHFEDTKNKIFKQSK